MALYKQPNGLYMEMKDGVVQAYNLTPEILKMRNYIGLLEHFIKMGRFQGDGKTYDLDLGESREVAADMEARERNQSNSLSGTQLVGKISVSGMTPEAFYAFLTQICSPYGRFRACEGNTQTNQWLEQSEFSTKYKNWLAQHEWHASDETGSTIWAYTMDQIEQQDGEATASRARAFFRSDHATTLQERIENAKAANERISAFL